MKHSQYEERMCLKCGKTWKILIRKPRKTSKRRYFCNECSSILNNWEKKKLQMESFPGYRELYLEQKKQEFLKTYIKHMLNKTKDRAIKKGIEFSINIEDINIPDKCPILEVPLVIGTKNNYEYTPSIDRIDNSKGYIKGNIQIISKKANSMKNSASIEELKKFCKNILRYSLTSKEEEFTEQENKESLG